MSCFWDSITQRLNDSELKQLGCIRNTNAIIEALKIKCTLMPDVLWQGTPLSTKFQQECQTHVKEFKSSSYKNGYLTSSGDPFLILLAQLFNWKIEFRYLSVNIKIENKKPKRTVRFTGSRTHFS